MNEQQIEKRNKLAANVLRLSRNTLLVNLRFLDMALSCLQPAATNLTTLCTDGQYLAYDPTFILRRYKQEKEVPVRDYLHVVFHCIFRHMYIHSLMNQTVWDLACDIAVEQMINDLGLKSTCAARERQQQVIIQKLREKYKVITAERLYRCFLDENLPEEEMLRLRELFKADDHGIWYLPPEEKIQISIQFRTAAGSGSGSDSESSDSGSGNTPDEEGDLPNNNSTSAATEADWENISQRMQQDIEMFSKLQGNTAGDLMQNLREVNRERYDYTAFLKKFAVLGEAMKINDDEFDYIYYTYGLQLYDKMPLIEPLEYKEVKRIREFVIAIDTSGSVAGDLVQRFIQKTYNILQSTESFFSKINVHIIQCDTEIQEDAKITSREDFDRYLNNMKLRGLGGTDFRPVFSYVDELIRNKEFQNLKGLIYFTDGYGDFPAKKPDYDTAFVFIDDGINNYDVPPWAIKLILQKEEI